MKVQVSQVVVAVAPLKKLGGLSDLTAKQAYRCAKMLRKAQAVFDDFEKGKTAAAKKCGTDIGGGQYEIAKEKIDDFNRELTELLDSEADLNCDVVVLSGDVKGLTPHDLIALEPFVSVEGE